MPSVDSTLVSVVSYRNSTSNHNFCASHASRYTVVSYRNSTSNHNCRRDGVTTVLLYLIEILHQTTTLSAALIPLTLLYLIEILHQTTTLSHGRRLLLELYLIEILHQTTTARQTVRHRRRCILSKFYIKPQL